ncbi:MAG: hypothetical protein HDR52_08900 [Treponema sp.]|nr:hypothetical protein [Treponema sp.]
MFSCPTDDIHSIYFDKELPAEFITQYESHVSTCSRCQQKLEHLRNVCGFFKADSNSITMDSVYMQQSYDRLKTKLRYAKNTGASRKNASPHTIAYIASMAAAFALAIVLPVGLKAKKTSFTSQTAVSKIQPIERPQNTPISHKNIVINENINDNLAYSVNFGDFGNVHFADVDVFRPHFDVRIPLYGAIDASELDYFRGGNITPKSSVSLQGWFPFPVNEMQDYQRE